MESDTGPTISAIDATRAAAAPSGMRTAESRALLAAGQRAASAEPATGSSTSAANGALRTACMLSATTATDTRNRNGRGRLREISVSASSAAVR